MFSFGGKYSDCTRARCLEEPDASIPSAAARGACSHFSIALWPIVGHMANVYARFGRCGGTKGLFMRMGEKMMVVDVNMTPIFSAGTPRLLFQGKFAPPSVPLGTSDISPDGERFLMMQRVAENESAAPLPTQINVVQNWFEELESRVATGSKWVNRLHIQSGF